MPHVRQQMTGTVHDTYVAALQHDIAAVPGAAVKLGVVRRPTPWFYAQVDANLSALGPPEELLDAFKDRYKYLQDEGLDDADAHNTALEEIDYDDRYRAYLNRSDEAQQALAELRDQLTDGEDVVLVCYENTENKRCHRTILKTHIRSNLL